MFNKKIISSEIICANDFIGCLGKLPIHTEFIKHRIILPEIANLDRWYQNAYSHLMRRFGDNLKQVFTQWPLYHFIYFTPTQLHLIGTLLASADKSGRAYPFVIFRFIEHPLAKELPLLIPISYENFFSTTKAICQRSCQNYSLPQLFIDIDSLSQVDAKILRLNILEQAVEGLKRISLAEFWDLVNKKGSKQDLSAFVNTLLVELFQLKNKLALGKIRVLSLPLIEGNANKISIIFWLQLLDFLPNNEKERLQLFWCESNAWHRASLYIYFKPLQPADLYQLMIPEYMDNQFVDVMCLAGNTQSYSLKINLPNVNPSFSLFQILQEWSRFLKGESYEKFLSATG